MPNQSLTTWSGTFTATPEQILAPQSAAAVADAVRRAAERRGHIRMIGSLHSFTDAAMTDGTLLRPDGLTSFLGIGSTSDGATTVEVGAGMDLTRLCHELDYRGLALTNMGDIRAQTVAGAIQTGTHGTGRTSGGLASMVTGLEIVTGDGQIRRVSRTEDPELFHCATVGLGAFGIITAVTLAVEKSFRLRAHEFPSTLDRCLGEFDAWEAEHDHLEFYWFPGTQRCLVKHNDRTREPAAPPNRLRAWLDDEALSNTAFEALQRIARKKPGWTRAINEFSGRALSERTYTDTSWRVFTSERRVRFKEMEYSVPREQLIPALREAVAYMSAADLAVPFPVEVRTAPADDAYLSPAHGRRSGFLAFHVYAKSEHRPYFDAIEAIMLSHNGRPHWGKLHGCTADDLADRYPKWDTAAKVRVEADPASVFSNPYTRRVLGF